jgi:phospholipid/cholesterol/gamma-HCH transport system substrate-binding protein
MKADLEVKVGIFVIIGLILLSIMIFSIGGFYNVKPGYNIKVTFSFANGVEVGAPVRLAGVEIGEIKNIRIFYDEKLQKTQVELLAWVEKGVPINNDAKANINTLGLLGEKYLEIFPGTPGMPVLQEGDSLIGHDPISTEEFTELGYKIALKLDQAIDSINKIVADPNNKQNLEQTLANLKEASSNFKQFSEDIKFHPWKLLQKPKR